MLSVVQLIIFRTYWQISVIRVIFRKLLPMSYLKSNLRIVACIILLLAFLFPVFRGLTALDFIQLAIKETQSNTEITPVDLLIVLTPLFTIPVTAIAIIIRSSVYVNTRKTLLCLPLICFFFFFIVFYFGTNRQLDQLFSFTFFSKIGFGFYLGSFSALLIPFTPIPERKTKKERQEIVDEVALVN